MLFTFSNLPTMDVEVEKPVFSMDFNGFQRISIKCPLRIGHLSLPPNSFQLFLDPVASSEELEAEVFPFEVVDELGQMAQIPHPHAVDALQPGVAHILEAQVHAVRQHVGEHHDLSETRKCEESSRFFEVFPRFADVLHAFFVIFS